MTQLAQNNHPFKLVSGALKPDKSRVHISKEAMKMVRAAVSTDDEILFNAYVNDLGQILLDPVITIPAHEAWLFKNPEALNSLMRGLKQAAEGETEYLGSFADYEDDDE